MHVIFKLTLYATVLSSYTAYNRDGMSVLPMVLLILNTRKTPLTQPYIGNISVVARLTGVSVHGNKIRPHLYVYTKHTVEMLNLPIKQSNVSCTIIREVSFSPQVATSKLPYS